MSLALSLGSNGKPLATIDNIERLFEHHHIKHRFNTATEQYETEAPGILFAGDRSEKAARAYIVSLMAEVEMATDHLVSFLIHIGEKNKYRPAYAKKTLKEERLKREPIEERILAKYVWDRKSYCEWKTVREVARDIGSKIHGRLELNDIARILRKLNCQERVVSSTRLFTVPVARRNINFNVENVLEELPCYDRENKTFEKRKTQDFVENLLT